MPARFAIDKSLVIDDRRFHYRDWGGEGRLFLLLHDVGSTAHVWDLVAPLLADDGHTVALDLRGHGQSDKPTGDYSFETMSADVRGVIAALVQGSDPKPVIIGHGWGARVALHTVATHALAPYVLVLVDGAVIDMRRLPHPVVEARYHLPEGRGAFEMAFRERILAEAPQGVITPAVEAAIMARYVIDVDDQVFARLPDAAQEAILTAIGQQALEPLYAGLDVPLNVILSAGGGAKRQQQLADGVALIARCCEDSLVQRVPSSVLELPLQRPHALVEAIRKGL